MNIGNKLLQQLFCLLGIYALAAGQSLNANLMRHNQEIAAPGRSHLAGINETRLANGLQVVLIPDHTQPTITTILTYFAGSRHESSGQRGWAHAVEHLMGHSSTRHAYIDQEFSQRGVDWNARTFQDRTIYFATFTDKNEHLDWYLGLEADRMNAPRFSQEVWEKEKGIIKDEFQTYDSEPGYILQQRVTAAAYPTHSYGYQILGLPGDVGQANAADLLRFQKMYYRPDNALLVVTGNFSETSALQLINKHFGAISKPVAPLPQPTGVEFAQTSPRQVVYNGVGKNPLLYVAYHVPQRAHPDYAALAVAARLLSDEANSPLRNALVKSRKAVTVDSVDLKSKDPGLVFFGATVTAGASPDTARELLLRTLENPSRAPARHEVERVKQALLNELEQQQLSAKELGFAASEWAAMGDWLLFFRYRDRISQVTEKDVARVIRYYFRPANRTLGVFIPDENPERVEIPTIPDDQIERDLIPYREELLESNKNRPAQPPLATATPVLSLESRVQRAQAGGLQLSFLPKQTRSQVAVARLRLSFGDEGKLGPLASTASVVGEMLRRDGTKRLSKVAFQDELNSLNAQVFINANGSAVDITCYTTRLHLLKVLRLVAEKLRTPALTQETLGEIKEEWLADLEGSRFSARNTAQAKLARHLDAYPKNHIYHYSLLNEDIAALRAVKLSDVIRFHREFYGASQGELALVGDFDPQSAWALANELFAGWHSKTPYVPQAGSYAPRPALRDKVSLPGAGNAFFAAGMNLNLNENDPDYPALLIGNFLLGDGSFLNARLPRLLREQTGLSYEVSSSITAGASDANGRFSVEITCHTENLGRVEELLRGELENVTKQGFTDQEVAAAQSGYLEIQRINQADDERLARKLNRYARYRRSLAWDTELEKQIAALTPEQIRLALKKHLDLSQLSVVVAGDFSTPQK